MVASTQTGEALQEKPTPPTPYERRVKDKYTFTKTLFKHDIICNYPDFPLEAWVLLNWFYKNYTNLGMQKDNEGFMRVESDLVISRLYDLQIRDRNAVTKHFKWLCGDNGGCTKEFQCFLERKTTYNISTDFKGPTRKSWYRPTQASIDYFEMDKAACDSVRELGDKPSDSDEPDTTKPEWVPSKDLIAFKDAVVDSQPNLYAQSEFIKKGIPVKYWQDTEEIIVSLIEGTFMKKFGRGIVDPPKVPKMTLQQIVEVSKGVSIPTGTSKPNAKSVFINHTGKLSPFITHYIKLFPPVITVSEERLAELKVKHPRVFENTSAGILEYVGKLKGLTVEDPAAYVLYDKFKDLYDEGTIEDCNKFNTNNTYKLQKNHVGVMLRWYIEMCIKRNKFGEDYYKTWHEWASSLKVGKCDIGSTWYIFVMHVYEVKHIWITDSPSMQKKILESIAKREQRRDSSGQRY